MSEPATGRPDSPEDETLNAATGGAEESAMTPVPGESLDQPEPEIPTEEWTDDGILVVEEINQDPDTSPEPSALDSSTVPPSIDEPVDMNADDIFADAEELPPPSIAGGREDVTSNSDEEVGVNGESATSGADDRRKRFQFVGFNRRSRSESADAANGVDPPTTDEPSIASTAVASLAGVRRFLDPGLAGIDLRWIRRILAAVLLLVLALLLANLAGAALILASAAIPVVIVMLLAAHDVFERESSLLLVGLVVGGLVAGTVLGHLAAWVVRSQWFDVGHLNFGAGGFGGHFAPGAAPFIVWLIAGLLLPAAMIAGIAAVPILLRRWPRFTNEVMDGMILAGASAAGLAIGLSTAFWWPMTHGEGPLMDVSGWTLMIVSQVFLRPLVITLSGAMIGAGVWRYMLQPSGSIWLVAPAVGGVIGIMALALGSLSTQPSGIWPEFLVTLGLAVLVFIAYRATLDLAVEVDSAVLGTAGERVVCPACHLVTPVGQFCARCGKPLQPTRE